MLKRYLEMIEKAFDAMTNLGGNDATWADYFRTVGLELLTLLVGIAYVLVFIAVIAFSIISVVKIIKSERLGRAWKRHVKDVQEYNQFVCQYDNLIHDLINSVKAGEKTRIISVYEEITKLLDSKNILYSRIDSEILLKTDSSLIKYIYDVRDVFKLPILYSYYVTDLLTEDIGDFSEYFKPKTYGRFCFSFKIMQASAWIQKGILIFGVLSLYAVFVIPLILMFFH